MKWFVWALLSGLFCVGPVGANEPVVPPGKGTIGGVSVALLGPGLDYRLPELQRHLARDGEGDLIGWDFSDGDNRPFAEGGIGTDAAREIAHSRNATIVAVKERVGDAQAFGHMMSFAANTPARIVVWLTADPGRPDWPIFLEAVKRFKDHMFIVPLGVGKISPSTVELARLRNVFIAALSADPPGKTPAMKDATSKGSAIGKLVRAGADAFSLDRKANVVTVKKRLADVWQRLQAEAGLTR